MPDGHDSFLGVIIDGRYRIETRIGDGGMGVVYRASHVVLKKPLAIKVLRGQQARDPDVVQRFMQEAKAASAIGHPNIVSISDFGTMEDGAVYLAMEYLVGQTLAAAMSAGPLTYARSLDIFVQITGALAATHDRGIVHRDLKPENVFLKREPENPDFVKVLDFGIAKVRNAAAKLTRTGMVFGTPHYMSPEQAAGQPVDHRSDIYSLGVIMYQALAGQLPFSAESFMEILTKHMYEPPTPLHALGFAIPPVLENLVLQCLQKKPEDRPQSMTDVQAVLHRVQVLGPLSEPTLSAPPARIETLQEGMPQEAPVRSHQLHAVPLPYPTGGTTLAAASEHTVFHDDEDDQAVAVPKVKRPKWLWFVAIGVVAAIALLSLFASPPSEPPVDAADAEAQPATVHAAPLPAEPEPQAPPVAAEPAPLVAAPEPTPAPAAAPAQPARVKAAAARVNKPAAAVRVPGENKPVSGTRHDSVPAPTAAKKNGAASELADPWQ